MAIAVQDAAVRPQRRTRREPAAPEQEWLTTPQVAAIYGVTTGRVRQLIGKGTIKAQQWGRQWRVSRKWLDVQHQEAGGVPPGRDPFLSPFGGGLDAEAEDALRRIVREELRAALADLAAGLAAVLRPPADELRPRRRGM